MKFFLSIFFFFTKKQLCVIWSHFAPTTYCMIVRQATLHEMLEFSSIFRFSSRIPSSNYESSPVTVTPLTKEQAHPDDIF